MPVAMCSTFAFNNVVPFAWHPQLAKFNLLLPVLGSALAWQCLRASSGAKTGEPRSRPAPSAWSTYRGAKSAPDAARAGTPGYGSCRRRWRPTKNELLMHKLLIIPPN